MPQKHIKDLVTRAATHILDNGGVVRKLDSWGTRTLPQRMRRAKTYYNIGECVSCSFMSRDIQLTVQCLPFQLLDDAVRRFTNNAARVEQHHATRPQSYPMDIAEGRRESRRRPGVRGEDCRPV